MHGAACDLKWLNMICMCHHMNAWGSTWSQMIEHDLHVSSHECMGRHMISNDCTWLACVITWTHGVHMISNDCTWFACVITWMHGAAYNIKWLHMISMCHHMSAWGAHDLKWLHMICMWHRLNTWGDTWSQIIAYDLHLSTHECMGRHMMSNDCTWFSCVIT
jgi:hypothetical protein